MTNPQANTTREQLFDDIRAAGAGGLIVIGGDREAALDVLVQQGRVSVNRGRAKAINDLDIPPLATRRKLLGPRIYA